MGDGGRRDPTHNVSFTRSSGTGTWGFKLQTLNAEKCVVLGIERLLNRGWRGSSRMVKGALDVGKRTIESTRVTEGNKGEPPTNRGEPPTTDISGQAGRVRQVGARA